MVEIDADRAGADAVEEEGQGKALAAAELQDIGVSYRNMSVGRKGPANLREDVEMAGGELAILPIVLKQVEVTGEAETIVS
jgi:hypothetical protein